MQKSFLHFLLLITCLSWLACEQNKQNQDAKKPEETTGIYVPDTIYSDNYGYALTKQDKNCLADTQGLICEFGLSAIAMLGFPLDELEIDKQFQVMDTLMTQGGYQWRIKELNSLVGGKIVLEGNFVDEGDPANRLPQSSINRIRVESKQFQTADGLRVGQTFAELKSQLDEAAMVAIYIPAAKVVDLTLPEVTGLRYNFGVELDIDAQEGFSGKEINAGSIPDSAVIESIVVTF